MNDARCFTRTFKISESTENKNRFIFHPEIDKKLLKKYALNLIVLAR